MARLNFTQAEQAKATAEVVVQNEMGSAGRLIGDGFSITYRNNKDSVKTITDWEQVAKAYHRILHGALQLADPGDAYIAVAASALYVDPADPRGAEGFIKVRPDDVDAMESMYTRTETKQGSRVFRPTWRDKQG